MLDCVISYFLNDLYVSFRQSRHEGIWGWRFTFLPRGASLLDVAHITPTAL